MKFRLLISLVCCGMLLCAPVAAMGASKSWEALKTERSDARYVVRDSETEKKTARGVIIISSSRPLQVKVFTILGQLVSSETIAAGTSQFAPGAHGVYIVKAGDLTCKVAL